MYCRAHRLDHWPRKGGPAGRQEWNARAESDDSHGFEEFGVHCSAVWQKPSGCRDEHLPTMHGFDRFFGILYHLNAYNELEYKDYPNNPVFRENLGPRNPVRSVADDDGTQTIEDMGPLDRERMKTLDDEVLSEGFSFLELAKASDQPFLLWMNSTRMHYPTYVPDEWKGV